MIEKAQKALLDLVHLLFAGVLTALGVAATGDWKNDAVVAVFAAVFMLLKAINPVDTSFGLTKRE